MEIDTGLVSLSSNLPSFYPPPAVHRIEVHLFAHLTMHPNHSHLHVSNRLVGELHSNNNLGSHAVNRCLYITGVNFEALFATIQPEGSPTIVTSTLVAED